MVASIGSGADIVALFGTRPHPPAARPSARSETPFQARPEESRPDQRTAAGGPPPRLLPYEAAAALQEAPPTAQPSAPPAGTAEASGRFEALTAADFRALDKLAAAAPDAAPGGRPTRPGRPSILDISV